MLSVMNTTKWKEVQQAMCSLSISPKWRTRCLTNGYISAWDGEWYYHFSEGGFKDIEWAEIKVENQAQFNKVLALLKSIHVPAKKTETGFKIFGYVNAGNPVGYL